MPRRSRLDATITFKNLAPEVVLKVVDKFVIQLEAQLADRHVTIEMTDAAKKYLSEIGYDRLLGARPLGRIMQEKIKQPLAEELLFGRLTQGGHTKIDIKDGKFIFDITPREVEEGAPKTPYGNDELVSDDGLMGVE